MVDVVKIEKDFDKNPPDFLALSGVFNVVANGCGYCGVLTRPTDAFASAFEYKIYALALSSDSSLAQRAADVARILEIPEKEQSGILKDRATYGRIRSFDHPTDEPLITSCHINDAQMLAMSVVRELYLLANPKHVLPHEKKERDKWAIATSKGPGYEAPDLDLKHIVFSFVDIRAKATEIKQWVDCLYSAIASNRVSFPKENESVKAKAEKSIQDIKFTPQGTIETADPLTMALLFSIGRAEWLAIQGRAPIQRELRRRRDAALSKREVTRG